MAGPAVLPDAARIQSVTEEILKRREFHKVPAAAPRVPGWLQGLLDRLGTVVFGSVTLGRLIGWIVIAAVVTTLIIVILRLLLSEPSRLHDDAAPGSGPGKPVGNPEGPEALLEDAERALGAGDMRAAVQPLYRACLDQLSREKLVKIERWKTNLTYLRECPHTASQYPTLNNLTNAYDEIVYAHRGYALEELQRLLVETRGFCGP